MTKNSKNKTNLKAPLGVWGVLFIILLLSACTKPNQYITNVGRIHGTFYKVVYLHPQGIDLQEKIEARMREFEMSLSIFNPNSVISRINQNDPTVTTDYFFETMFAMAQQVSEHTDGAFDITVAPLVNAWGFGFGDRERTEIPDVEAILPFVGFRKIRLENHRLIKDDPRIMLDANAIAKGYSADVIAQLLEENGVENFMVEIGGEIVTRGLNPRGEKWRLGINKPIEDPTNTINEIQRVVAVSGYGIATSGTNRQFYRLESGQLVSHTIDPRTGFPVSHNLLSVTVIASSAMKADAYATAFMVLGTERALEISNEMPDLDVFLIYSDENGEFQYIYSDGFERFLINP